MKKIKQIENNSLSCIRSFMDVDPLKTEDEDSFRDALLFAEPMLLKKKHTRP